MYTGNDFKGTVKFLLLGFLFFCTGCLGVGILIGWLIWG